MDCVTCILVGMCVMCGPGFGAKVPGRPMTEVELNRALETLLQRFQSTKKPPIASSSATYTRRQSFVPDLRYKDIGIGKRNNLLSPDTNAQGAKVPGRPMTEVELNRALETLLQRFQSTKKPPIASSSATYTRRQSFVPDLRYKDIGIGKRNNLLSPDTNAQGSKAPGRPMTEVELNRALETLLQRFQSTNKPPIASSAATYTRRQSFVPDLRYKDIGIGKRNNLLSPDTNAQGDQALQTLLRRFLSQEKPSIESSWDTYTQRQLDEMQYKDIGVGKRNNLLSPDPNAQGNQLRRNQLLTLFKTAFPIGQNNDNDI